MPDVTSWATPNCAKKPLGLSAVDTERGDLSAGTDACGSSARPAPQAVGSTRHAPPRRAVVVTLESTLVPVMRHGQLRATVVRASHTTLARPPTGSHPPRYQPQQRTHPTWSKRDRRRHLAAAEVPILLQPSND